MFCTNAANIITVCSIQLYFKLRSPTSPNPGPVSFSQIRSPNILANIPLLGSGIFLMWKMLQGDIETSKYSLHLSVALGVRTHHCFGIHSLKAAELDW